MPGSNSRMISPSTPIDRGIQIVWPKAFVIRSAMLVLPLPGAPNRNMPRPELIAGPSRSSIFLSIKQVFERAVQVFFRRMLIGERLLLDAVDVRGQRHGRRAKVRAMLGKLLGPFAAQLGELVDVVVHRGRALVGDQPILLHRVQQRIDDPKRQLQMIGQIAARRFGAAVERLENQGFDFAIRQPGGGQRFWLDRHPLAAGGWCASGTMAQLARAADRTAASAAALAQRSADGCDPSARRAAVIIRLALRLRCRARRSV